MALTVSGTASFVNEGKTLVAEFRLQPATEHEHNLLASIVMDQDDPEVLLDKGQLVLKLKLPVPGEPVSTSPGEATAPEAQLPATESVSPSTATSAKTEEPLKVGDLVQFKEGLGKQMAQAAIELITPDGEFALFAHSGAGVPLSELVCVVPAAVAQTDEKILAAEKELNQETEEAAKEAGAPDIRIN